MAKTRAAVNQWLGVITEAITYYVCPAAQTTAVYNGAAGVAVTPSDTNDGLTTTTPFATIQKARDVIAGKILFAPVTIQLADTDATRAYFPDGVLFDNPCLGGGVNLFDIAIGGEADAYPTSYVHIKGNLTTPNNVAVVGALTYNGTVSDKFHAFQVKNSNFRAAGMQFKYFKSAQINGTNYALIYAETLNAINTIDTNTSDQDGIVAVSENSCACLGGSMTITGQMVVMATGCSTVRFRTPLGYANITFSSNGATYPQFGICSNEKSHIYQEGLTISFAGTGAYNCFGCLIGSTINWNSDVASSCTVNAANAVFLKARQGGYIAEACGALNQTGTFTAMNRRAWAEDGGYITLGSEAGLGTSGLLQRSNGYIHQATATFPEVNMYLPFLTAESRQLQSNLKIAGNQTYHTGVFQSMVSEGTLNTPTAILLNRILFQLEGTGHDGTDYQGAAAILMKAAAAFSGSDHSSKIQMEVTNLLSRFVALEISPNGALSAIDTDDGVLKVQTWVPRGKAVAMNFNAAGM